MVKKLKIYDGRERFYQWDIDQKITSNTFKVGDEIHFYNRKLSTTPVVIAYELGGKVVADVPNILLQSSSPITAYRYITDENGSKTIEEHTFEVTQRPKPDDYVYTETEIYTIKTAVDKALLEAKESGEFDGADGKDGKDGVSCEHSWYGTTLTITSASGSSSADLKGDKGDKGDTGEQGNDYVLTPSDKTEIANIVLANFTDVAEVGQ